MHSFFFRLSTLLDLLFKMLSSTPTLLFLLFSSSLAFHPPLQIRDEEDALYKKREVPKGLLAEREFARLADEYRLNASIIPTRYDLELTIILEGGDDNVGPQFTAPGRVGIDLRTNLDDDTATRIVLHVNTTYVTINHDAQGAVTLVRLSDNSALEVTGSSVSGDDAHFLYVDLAQPLENNTDYRLTILFVTEIATDRTNGLYVSNYTDDSNNTRHLAATQMEPFHGRQMLPCFDEPRFKPVFDIKIHHKNNTIALGNGASDGGVAHPNYPGWLTTTFTTTVPMPLYLVALTIADFDYVEADPSLFPGRPVRTYATPAQIREGWGNYSVDLTARLLQYFDDIYNTSYPMPKMDSVAVPQKGGAMENWGLVLYRFDRLVYLQGEVTEIVKNGIASVISHEVAHQNFGNLVTCQWWSDLWLNEGFATYVSYLGVDYGAPEFRHYEWQITDALQSALDYDAGPNTYPLRNNALTPDQIDAIFSTITYDKGSSINRMVSGFLTEDTFRRAIALYLDDMADKVAVQDDLFRNLQIAAVNDGVNLPATISEILEGWTLQVGFPLIRVSVADANRVFITQEPYRDSAGSERWYVPISVITQSNSSLSDYRPRLWLRNDETITTTAVNTNQWVLINYNATGFYRTLYDSTLTTLIQNQLRQNAEVISPLSRSQLVDDYLTFAFRGLVDIDTALSLTTYLEQEDNYVVWNAVFKHFTRSYTFIESDDDFISFAGYLLPKISTALNRLGLEQNDELHIGLDGMLRARLFDWACSLNHFQCTSYSLQLQGSWEQEGRLPPIDIQASVACTIAASGETGYEFILRKYGEETSLTNVKTRLLNALACVKDPATIQRVLNTTISVGSPIHDTHRITLIQQLASNTAGRLIVLDFINANFNRFESGEVERILTSLGSQMSTQQQLDRVLSFINSHSDQLSPSVNNAVNSIRSNMQWMAQYGRPILKFMGDNRLAMNGGSMNSSGYFGIVLSLLLVVSSKLFL